MSARPYDAIKRVIDIVSAALLLVLTSPLQLVVGALVALNLGRPILFRQPRPGRAGVVFTLLKFRSMRDIDKKSGLISDTDRLTAFGRALRATSLDELPALWNVLQGEMSLVGPRPLLVEYLDKYTPEQTRRHEVRPGITGLAQVNGRNALTWEQKLHLDIEYVEHRSLSFDVKILLRTIGVVFRRDGINHKGQATMHKFGEDPDED